MDAIYRLARKNRVEPELLPQLWRDTQARLDKLQASADVAALQQALAQAAAEYARLAQALSAVRAEAAGRLSAAVSEQMQRMAMGGSRFVAALSTQDRPSPYGAELIEFQVAPHAAAPARPLAKVASGGELSRISLALQVVTSQVAAVPTLIFDEVDVGIGGGVAQIVGELLRALGREHQVLCVTHLPQVAACGDQHLQVSKSLERAAVTSRIAQLDRSGRIEEIARMLGGVEITDTTRRHADELLGLGA